MFGKNWRWLWGPGLLAFALVGLVACEWGGSPRTEPTPVHSAVSLSQALIGGKPDRSLTSVGGLSRSSSGGTFCTATLIARRIVLTAAHCVRSGTYKTSGSPYFRMELPVPNSASGYKFVYYSSELVSTHPKWRGSVSQGYDIAVVILKNKVDPSQAIPMRYNKTALDSSYVGKELYFLGYGAIARGWRYPKIKYGAKIPITSVRSDRLIHRAQGKSICFGDSGGPSMLQFNGQWHVAGVNSYVVGSCYGSGASTRTDTFTVFLEKYRKQYGEGGSCTSDSDCDPCYVCSAQKLCVQATVQKNPKACRPCRADTDCNGGVCHDFGGIFRCLQLCSNNHCCPSGQSCSSLAGKKACMPSVKVCPPVLCQQDSDCGRNEKCGLGVCGKACQGNTDCPSGSLCKGGVCIKPVPGKVGDSCANGQVCEQGLRCYDIAGKKICSRACSSTPIGRGSPGSACTTSGACNFDSQCIPLRSGRGNICLKRCSSTSDCLQGMTCKGVRRSSDYCFCQRDSECKQNEICNKSILGDYGACAPKQQGCDTGFECKDIGKAVTVCVQKTTSNPCGNGTCDAGENCSSCPQDCKCPSGQICQSGVCTQSNNCGNGVCEAGRNENCSTCAQDCKCASGEVCQNGACQPSSRCGNGTCESNQGENCSNCVQDCACSTGKICQNGSCVSASRCGNGTCESVYGENCSTCIQDCGCPLNRRCFGGACIPVGSCGNGTCESGEGENCDLCPADCACKATEACQKGVCVANSGCQSDSDCPTGFKCTSGVCVPPTPGGQEAPAKPDEEPSTPRDAGSSPDTPTPEPPSPPEPPSVDRATSRPDKGQTSSSEQVPDTTEPSKPMGALDGPCRIDGGCDVGLQCAGVGNNRRLCLRLPMGDDGLLCPPSKRVVQCSQAMRQCRIACIRVSAAGCSSVPAPTHNPLWLLLLLGLLPGVRKRTLRTRPG